MRFLLPTIASLLLISAACGPTDDGGNDAGGDSDGGGITDGGGGSCNSGERRCQDNDTQSCGASGWVMDADCAATGGVCVPGTPPSCMAATCNPNFAAGDACGGDITGTWHFAEACTAGTFQDTVQQACATATVTSESFAYTGSLNFDGPGAGLVARDIDITASMTVQIPKTDICAMLGCDTIATALADYVSTVSCSDTGTACDCAVTVASVTQDTAVYTVANGTLSVDNRTWHYCVDGQQISFREYPADAAEAFFTQVYVR